MSLYWAERAVDYVRTTIGMRSNNREWDRRQGVVDVSAARIEGFRRRSEAAANWQTELEAEVSAYRDLKAGNCYEMAKLAFVYLAANGQRPLEVAYLTPADAVRVRLFGMREEEEVEPDHAFVIIGRKLDQEERRERMSGYITVAPIARWNFGAVVCDPWAKRCYFGDRLPVESQMINRVSAGQIQLSSDIRLEEGQQWSP